MSAHRLPCPRRASRGALLALLVAGCGGGGGEDTSPNPDMTCDPYETEVLAEIPVDQWPPGLTHALESYNGLAGNFIVTDCDDAEVEHTIQFTIPPQDSTGVIEGGGPPEGVDCGCHLDPDYAPDTSMNPIAVLPEITMSIPQGLEPAGRPKIYQLSGVAFASGDDLRLRSCGHRTIDPADNSEYDDIYWFLRVDADGQADLTMLLTKLGSNEPPKECHFAALVPQ